MTENLNPGLYWVRLQNSDWSVAEYIGDDLWDIIGWDNSIPTSRFEDIDGREVKRD